MFRPVGPLSPSVYWRRRLLVAVLLVAVVLLLWALFGGGGPDNDGHDRAALPSENPVPTRTPLATITPSPGTGGPPASAETSHAALPAGDGAGGTGGAGSGSGAGSAGSTGGSGTGAASTVATCPDTALQLTVDTDRADYPPGVKPVIRLTLTNRTSVACRRDVGAATQEAIVYAGRTPGQHQFWSSNDCDPGGDPDVRVLGAGDTLRFSVTWPAVSSEPDCAGTERAAGPGDYTVVARVGSLRSEPVTFTLT